MGKSYTKYAACMILSILIVFSLIGCGNSASNTATTTNNTAEVSETSTPATVRKEPVKIKYPTSFLGTSVGAPLEKALIEGFNEKYGNEIELNVEEIPSDQAYIDKMKMLVASGDVPDIISGSQGLFDLLVKGGYAVDLMPYLDADPEWKADIGEGAIQANSRDGKLYSIDTDGAATVGYFYNKDLFKQVNITPAKTWDEFFQDCEKLKAAGIVPLALMTNENAWTTNLLLGSIVGTSNEAGNEFMNTKHPKNYETPEFIDGLTKIKELLTNYTTQDAVGAAYANAANNFFQGKAAMLPNGPWMIGDFSDTTKAPEGFANKVGVAIYPNDGVYISYWEGYCICSKDKEHQDAAAKFVKFKSDAHAQQLALELKNNIPLSPKVIITDEFRQKNPIMAELIDALKGAKYNYLLLDSINYGNVTDSFKTLYPELIYNKITPAEMAKKLSEIAGKNQD